MLTFSFGGGGGWGGIGVPLSLYKCGMFLTCFVLFVWFSYWLYHEGPKIMLTFSFFFFGGGGVVKLEFRCPSRNAACNFDF